MCPMFDDGIFIQEASKMISNIRAYTTTNTAEGKDQDADQIVHGTTENWSPSSRPPQRKPDAANPPIRRNILKLSKKLLVSALAFAGITAASAAYAGPPVTVTFKNNATAEATYTIITSNESSTYANASPKPATKVPAGANNVYTVTSLISPDVNYANVRYRIGTKECVFGTTFVNALQPGGYKIPTWNKSATGSGGAICTATITSYNLTTYAWTVDFIMK